MPGPEQERLLAHLKGRRVAVSLTTLNGTPLKAITVAGRCASALRAAAVPEDERKAFMDLLTAPAQAAAIDATSYAETLSVTMNRPGLDVLQVVQEYFVVDVNWNACDESSS